MKYIIGAISYIDADKLRQKCTFSEKRMYLPEHMLTDLRCWGPTGLVMSVN